MGRQYNKNEKRKRREAYLNRKKVALKATLAPKGGSKAA